MAKFQEGDLKVCVIMGRTDKRGIVPKGKSRQGQITIDKDEEGTDIRIVAVTGLARHMLINLKDDEEAAKQAHSPKRVN